MLLTIYAYLLYVVLANWYETSVLGKLQAIISFLEIFIDSYKFQLLILWQLRSII